MKYINLKNIALVAGLSLATTSCFKDLDTVPLDKSEITSAVIYDDPATYKKVLAKLYAGLALSGQEGPAGKPDIAGIDEGFSTYLRQYWKAQELPTDEAVIGWNDGNIKDYHDQDWDSQNEFIGAMYNRIFYQISLCNEFLRETTDAKLDGRGVEGTLRSEIVNYRAEARFLRALSYWHALDMFRNVPFVTEANAVGAFLPTPIKKDELFAWIETELKAIETDLKPARTNEYGRADQAAAWTLLAKLYLNGKVYTGKEYNTECVQVCEKILAAGYTLEPTYQNLFLADNHKASGIIFPVNFDGINSRTWGGMTFLVHAAVGGNMAPSDYGIDGGWGGIRTTSALVDKFPTVGGGSTIVAPNPGNTSYPVLYMPGAYQSWQPANASQLASPNSDGKFQGFLYLKDAGGFKFTVNPDWSVNYGDNGADGTLEANGANIEAQAGFYLVEVDINANTYKLTPTTWGLIGSATADQWNSDQNMSYDEAEGAWTIMVALNAGEVKFRANDDWGINYGDSGADGLLERDGANIAIPGPGTYTIKLYLDKPDHTYSIERPSFDSRTLMFHTSGQSKSIDDIGVFTNGYAIGKFKNVNSDGSPGKDKTFVDGDFPMFRIEDVMLMYAEAVLRGGSGSKSQAVDYVNQVRGRAYGDTSGNITESDLSLDFILDERARELVWECHRRTDLIRFGKFSGGAYIWPWKGGVKDGIPTSDCRDVYPLPASDVVANPNLNAVKANGSCN